MNILIAPEHAEVGLAIRLREGSMDEHRSAETRPFIEQLLGGGINARGYCEYLRRLITVYRALEEVGAALAADPVVGAIIDPRLDRLAALEADLAFWSTQEGGVEVSTAPSPAADVYAARIRETLGQPELYVAHHYTRYLGDLSGGLIIGKFLAREFKLDDSQGTAFYHFDEIPKPKVYKDAYRSTLDALPLTEAQKESVLTETKAVFGYNEAIFDELGEQMDAFRR